MHVCELTVEQDGSLRRLFRCGGRWEDLDDALGFEPGMAVSSLRAALSIFALTNSFANCKNAIVEAEQRSLRVGKGRHKQKHEVTVHTLRIDGATSILREGGELRADGGGLRRALHLCRGHFKDYRNSGLFGKYKGLYWWPESRRGDESAGEVFKQYEVDRPRDSDAPE